MTVTRQLFTGSALVLLVSLGCGKSHGEEAGDGKTGTTGDFVRYAPDRAPLDFIKIETVKESSGATSTTLTGRVTYDEDHTQRVASPIDGRAVGILVQLGDKVRAGQPLIRLSSPNVGQLQADAQKSLSDLTVDAQSVDRVRKLQADGAISQKEVAQVEGDFRKARSDHARSTAQLKSLGVSPTDPTVNAVLRAQIPGTVVERNVLAGQEVRADQVTPLVTISSLDAVWVIADAYEQDMALVQEGARVTVRVSAYPGEAFAGTVGHIADVLDAGTRTVKVRCVVANPGHRLKPEMFAKVEVASAGGRQFVTVPSKAILSEGDRALVVVATEGNVFRTRRVDVGPESDGQVRILGNLAPGEKIVTDGAIFMKRQVESQ
jgi:cobalt-zinc-cadmium efflux system membrane fusion protein